MDSSETDRMILRQQFGQLLRSGLWGQSAGIALFTGHIGWTALFRMAQTQALTGILFDGVETLPAEYHPPKELYVRWCAYVAKVQQTNEWLDSRLVQVVELYRGAGLQPVLLKGQGIARSYRQPNHRQCGDIDLYVGKRHYSVANRLLREHGATPSGEEGEVHASFNFRGAQVENHRFVIKLHSPCANRHFQQLCQCEMHHPTGVACIEECAVQLPSATFNALYLFIHAFKHLLGSGVGLRQLCDWCRLLYTEYDNIDYTYLENELRTLHLMKSARTFGYIAIRYLGLPSHCFPFEVDSLSEEGEKLLDELFATGNFGQYDTRIAPRPTGYWAGKWYTFIRSLRRTGTLYQLAPIEALFVPLTLVRNTLAIQWYRFQQRRQRQKQATRNEQHPDHQSSGV